MKERRRYSFLPECGCLAKDGGVRWPCDYHDGEQEIPGNWVRISAKALRQLRHVRVRAGGTER